MKKVLLAFLFIIMASPFAWSYVSDNAGAVISNGNIEMGVNQEGHLNTPISNDPLGIGYMGLRYVPTGAASTEPGCQCEGWGAADSLSGATGYANVSTDGVVNLTVLSFTQTASTAVSVVQVGSTYEVTHDYHPSASANLYEVTVTVKNISDSATNLLYRRVMDWDIYPTPFDEYVTISDYSGGNLIRTDTNGFDTANPLNTFGSYQPGPVVDAGPSDHGALFDFDFGLLNPGESKTFNTYYGATATESAAYAALTAVGAQTYSFAQANVTGGPDLGIPNTFIFAFEGVGLPPVENPVPEPSTLILLGSALVGLGIARFRKK